MPFCDRDAVLAAINRLRKHHGTPPLQWSDECAHYAQRCASACKDCGRHEHCFLKTETSGRRMGQSIYFAMQEAKQDVAGVVEAWYQEVGKYDFKFPGYQLGTSHFTALVWFNSTHVGMAACQDERFFVANYWPRGNVVGRASGAKEFELNVLRPESPLVMRPRNDREAKLFEYFAKLARGRNKIPLNELKRLFERIGENRLLKVIKTADLDGDGFLDPWELAISMVQPRDGDGTQTDAEVLEYVVGFVHFDVDCNLGLDKKELSNFLQERMCRQYSDAELRDILQRFDTDHDGLLDYKELMKFIDSGYLGRDPHQGGSFTMTKWDDAVEHLLESVPIQNRRTSIEDLRKHVEGGLAAKLTKTEDSVIVELARPGGGWRRLSVTPQVPEN
mmetsp:Transcript_80471/g.236684  ORF Transcript_80471/g.236684 Transcript_80471/m.236684 type:complete len:390 (-) Transcript_80471:143-1312(-)